MTSPLAWWRSFDAQSRALMVAGALNFTAVLFLPPPLFVWLLVADLCATCAGLGWWCLVLEGRVDEATTEALQQAHAARIANDLLDRYKADAEHAPVPFRPVPLRVVPEQRDGAHDALPVADETWLDEITEGRWTW